MDEMLEVLKEIRDEAKQTDVPIESFEKRLTHSLSEVRNSLDSYMERIDLLTRRQADSKLRLASEVLSLADVTREVRDLLARKLDDHEQVVEHEQRLRSIEDRIADK